MKNLLEYELVAAVKHVSGYDTNTTYYFALYDSSMKKGDYAIVGTTSNPQIVKVEEVLTREEAQEKHSAINKAILGKVDMSAFLAVEEKKTAIEKLKKEMTAKKKEIEARKDDEYYASIDPDYAALVEKMRALQGA